jgi:hypothetical protein
MNGVIIPLKMAWIAYQCMFWGFLRIAVSPLVMVHIYNPSTPEFEAGGLQVRGQPNYIVRLCLLKKKKKKGVMSRS